MKWLISKRHDNEMSWKSFMREWFKTSWNGLGLEHERRWLQRLVRLMYIYVWWIFFGCMNMV